MTGAQAQARDWRAFSARYKRHRSDRDRVRIGRGTWRSKPYCYEQGQACQMVTVLFPDQSGGYRVCERCGHTYGVGEY